MAYFENNLIDEYVEKIREYNTGNVNLEEATKLLKKIRSFSGVKFLIRDLNKEINIDFVKESEEIEEPQALPLSAFLKEPNTKILKVLPREVLQDTSLLSAQELDEKRKELLRKTIMIAQNINKNEIRKISYANHLVALNTALNLANKAKCLKKNKGKDHTLDPYMIMDTNSSLFEGTYMEGDSCIGSYRSQYNTGRISIIGARWTPVKSSKVAENMDALLKWYNNEKDLHPIERAAILHIEFIRIHPFSDGNGRTARILMNYELVKHGYPTVVIKARDKKEYINALEEGIMTKNVGRFVNFIKDAMLESENKYINVIREVKEIEKA